MEYGESLVKGGITYDHKCECCGYEKHRVQGVIRYVYFILESIPLFPVSRNIKLECVECLHIVEPHSIESKLKQSLMKSAFTIYQFIFRFIGILLIAYALLNWWQSSQLQQKQIAHIVSYPQINDFFLIDYRKLSDDLRPNEKYRIAKVIDITGDTVSLVYGNFFYAYQSSFEDAISRGQTRAFSYFSKNSTHYTFAEFKDLLKQEAIVTAARPEGNFLFGNLVINDTGYRVSATYNPGEREYASGLAFEQASYLQNYKLKAFEKFQKSAELGFALGQIKLAEYYLVGDVVASDLHSALYWLELAAMQSYKRAIKKYTIVCQQTKGCDEGQFYQRLINSGVNLTVNKSGFKLD